MGCVARSVERSPKRRGFDLVVWGEPAAGFLPVSNKLATGSTSLEFHDPFFVKARKALRNSCLL